MKSRSTFSFLSRSCLLAVSLVLCLRPVTAGAVTLDDAPIAVQNAKPNIMLLLDNSLSMLHGSLPDNIPLGNDNYVTLTTVTPNYLAGIPYGPWCTHKSYYAAEFNRQYYDPRVQYLPPYKSDGTQFSDATFTAAYFNPFNPSNASSPNSTSVTGYGLNNTGTGITYSGGKVNLATNYVPYLDTCIGTANTITNIGTGSIDTSGVLTFVLPDNSHAISSFKQVNNISPGMPVIGIGIPQGTKITAFRTGTGAGTGGAGTYQTNFTPSSAYGPQTIIIAGINTPAVIKGTMSTTTLTVTQVVSGVVQVGQLIHAIGVNGNTSAIAGMFVISGKGTGNGGTGTYSIFSVSAAGTTPNYPNADAIALGGSANSAGPQYLSHFVATSNSAYGNVISGYVPPDISRGVASFSFRTNPSTVGWGSGWDTSGLRPAYYYDFTAPAINPNTSAPYADAMRVPGPAFYCTYTGSTAPSSGDGTFGFSVANGSVATPLPSASDMAILRDDTQFTCKNPPDNPDPSSAFPYDSKQNFANWFSYYRTRILMIKSVVSIAFHNLTDSVRVGFLPVNAAGNGVTGNSTGSGFVAVNDFNQAQSTALLSGLNTVAVNGNTPLPHGLLNVGEYFRTSSVGGTARTNPITHSCQANFAIIATDGAWNVDATFSIPSTLSGANVLSNALSSADTGNSGKVPSPLPKDAGGNAVSSLLDPIAGVSLTPEAAWPRPYLSHAVDHNLNTLSNVALYYWVNDLRPSVESGCVVNQLNICTNNVRTSPTSSDPAYWQHLSTFAIGLGLNGYRRNPTDLTGIKSGSLDWPAVPINNTQTTDGTSAIDDLWHATVNGHGQYFSASNAQQIQTALNSALNTVIARSVVGNSVVVATPQITTVSTGNDNATFLSSYNSKDWTGDLRAFPILVDDTAKATTGLSAGSINTTNPLWPNQASTDASSSQAQYLLDTKVASGGSRYIVTYNGSSGGIAFQPNSQVKVGSAAVDTLQNILGNHVVEYLRGDRTYENGNSFTVTSGSTTTSMSFRTRTHLLGDIVNAEPAVLRPPYFSYFDSCYANTDSSKGCASSTFKSAKSGRTRMVFQGANDGMLHVFNAALASDSSNYANRGQENWAYIPNLVLAKLKGSLTTSPANVSYNHNYFVDGSPVIGDVDFSNTVGATPGSNPAWRTILVGGLGKGGRGYYALDVTDPVVSDESTAASKVLWEFPTAASPNVNMGYSFGRPAIVKTPGNGWVVLVPSGYNNGSADSGGDGHGHLFVLNARTGALIADLAASGDGGTAASPSNMGHISAHVASNSSDATADYAYGVNLNGQVWRFNLTESVLDSSGAAQSDHLGTSSTLTSRRASWVATLKDSGGTPQPITTEPEIATITIDGSPKRFVFVATGQYLNSSDLNNTQTQSVYGFIDDTTQVSTTSPVYNSPRNPTTVGSTSTLLLLKQTLGSCSSDATSNRCVSSQTDGSTGVTYSPKVDYANGQIGWYVDLPGDSGATPPVVGERVVARPILLPPGELVFTSNAPSADICLPGGTTWLNVFEYQNGGQVSGLNWSSAVMSNSGVGGGTLGVSVFQGQDGRIGFQVPGQPATILPQAVSQPPARRISWREIPEQ